MKVAVVHDWLPLMGGAERVLEQILKVFPGADVYTIFDFLDDKQRETFAPSKITTSYLNKWPWVKKYYRNLLPLCPQAIEDFDLSSYDLIVSSSHTVAKGVITGAQQTHVSYVHSPTRYAWDMMHQYLRETNMNKGIKGLIAKTLLHKFRIWDYRTANGVDYYIANSDFIRKRIWKVYRREADVIHPPVNVDLFEYNENKEDFYLSASRLVPYKRLDLIAQAFVKMPELKLKIIGDGPEMAKIRDIAKKAPNIELMGYQPNDVLKSHMQRAKAFVFAAEEDFGIIPVEAQACGTPIIAYGAGGALETVIGYEESPDKATGIFFREQTPESLVKAVTTFNKISNKINTAQCRKHAESFAPYIFRKRLENAVETAVKDCVVL
ncbi:MAG: glycosyltransferase family 4 protein [Alphaproteobacteria bacterium]|nr:glycosyltransferase family 4 protein [Alphaproteobacteria bacterium]